MVDENYDYSWYHIGTNDLQLKLESITNVIEHEISKDNPDQVQEKIVRLAAISALSAETVSQASMKLKEKQVQMITEFGKLDMPASILKIYIDGKCAEEFAVFTLADRLNKAITHCQDSLRTIISLHKVEL